MTLSQDEALQRERAISSLNALLAADRPRARAAMVHIASKISATMERSVLSYQDRHIETRKLLPVAKQVLLDPARMMEPASEECPRLRRPADPDDDVLMVRPQQRWQVMAFRAIGRLDHGVLSDVMNLTGHLRNAMRAGFGVVNRSPIDSYAFALSQVWAQGKQSYDGTCAYWRGMPSVFPIATPIVPLRDLVIEEVRAKPDRVRDRDEWTRAVVVLLFALDPEFDGVSHGLECPIEWEPAGFKDIFTGRARIKEHVEMAEPGFHARALGLFEQALVSLNRPSPNESKGQQVPAPAPESLPVLGRRARRTIILLQERPPQNPVTGPDLVKLYVRKWSDDRTLTAETWRSSVLKEVQACTEVKRVRRKGYWLAADSPARSWRFSPE